MFQEYNSVLPDLNRAINVALHFINKSDVAKSVTTYCPEPYAIYDEKEGKWLICEIEYRQFKTRASSSVSLADAIKKYGFYLLEENASDLKSTFTKRVKLPETLHFYDEDGKVWYYTLDANPKNKEEKQEV